MKTNERADLAVGNSVARHPSVECLAFHMQQGGRFIDIKKPFWVIAYKIIISSVACWCRHNFFPLLCTCCLKLCASRRYTTFGNLNATLRLVLAASQPVVSDTHEQSISKWHPRCSEYSSHKLRQRCEKDMATRIAQEARM